MQGIHNYIDKHAAAHPDRTAVVFGDRTISYEELRRDSCRVANRLINETLGDGARIATLLPNHPASFVCQFAINRTPYVWLPINAKSSRIECLELLESFRASWLFVHSTTAGDLGLIQSSIPSLAGIVCVDKAIDGAVSLEEWLAGTSSHAPEILIDPFHTAVLRTTGGSTGRPKGVKRTNLCQILQTTDYLTALPYASTPVNLVIAPLSHAGGSVAIPIFAYGGVQVILESTAPEAILSAIEHHKVTTVFMPPTLVYRLLSCPELDRFDLSSLKYLIYGSAPMAVDRLREGWQKIGPVFTQVYGLTEASSTISIMTPQEHATALTDFPERFASCGNGTASYRLKILNAQNETARPGELGEVLCASYELMTGYFENEEASRDAIQDGWLHTGDIGYLDEHGYLYIVDRKKDLIITGGFNVYPGEVEQIIFQHPAVHECAVVGSPDEQWGEAVTAVVQLKPGHASTPEEIIAHCKSLGGSVKAPKKVFIWDDLPRSPAGKVLRKDVRAHFWSGTNRSI